MFYDRFINEYGNLINVKVEKIDDNELMLSIEGPTSLTTNQITKNEARSIINAITHYLREDSQGHS